jgi:hypothetical protein
MFRGAGGRSCASIRIQTGIAMPGLLGDSKHIYEYRANVAHGLWDEQAMNDEGCGTRTVASGMLSWDWNRSDNGTIALLRA